MFRKLSEMCKKWFINLSAELDTRNAKFDVGMSVKQILFSVNLLLVFEGIRIS